MRGIVCLVTCSSCDFLHLFVIPVFRPQASSRSTKAHHNSRYCSTKFRPAPKKSTDWDCESKSAYSEFRKPAGQARPSYLVVGYERSEYQGVWGAVAPIAGENVEIQVSVGKASARKLWAGPLPPRHLSTFFFGRGNQDFATGWTQAEPQRLIWSGGLRIDEDVLSGKEGTKGLALNLSGWAWPWRWLHHKLTLNQRTCSSRVLHASWFCH